MIKNSNKPTEITKGNPKFAILIPARDESKVIEDLLKSIKIKPIKFHYKMYMLSLKTKKIKPYLSANNIMQPFFIEKV